MVSLIVPRLTAPDNSSLQTSISTGLVSVPETVAQQYPTVDAIYQALVQAAQASNASLKQSVQDGELPKELLNRTAASHQKWWLAAV